MSYMAGPNLAIALWPEPLRSLAYTSISGTYASIGNATEWPTRVYWIQNNSDSMLTFSWDGVNDHFVLPSDGYLVLDVTANKTNVGGASAVPAGTITYVKGSAGSGSVDLTLFYGKNS